MFTTFRPKLWSCAAVALLTVALFTMADVAIVGAQDRTQLTLLESLASRLKEPPSAEVVAAQATARQTLNRLQMELAEQAIGVILSKELELDRLQAELQKSTLDRATLDALAAGLRRKLPGKVQQSVNDLRASVTRLSQLLNSSASQLQLAHEALATVSAHLNDAHLRTTSSGGSQLRQAFATLAASPALPADIELLRGRLSIANYATLVKTRFLVDVSRRNFERPIQFQECKEGTSITGQGSFRVDLSLTVPPSQNENLLVLHAHGCGQIDAWASRQRISASARAWPQIEGSEAVHILPEKIVGDSPAVTARFSTQLSNVQMDGLLGRCRLVLRLLSRVIQSRLTANDGAVARQIEQTVRTRVQEEAYDLAYRINGLLRHSVWERILALDFTPAIQSYNDAEGARSQTSFVRANQLGALTPPPLIPAPVYAGLDMVTWVHESAANNVFESLGAIDLHEETIRALWQVQLKLTSDSWTQPQPARIPTVVRLADRWPLKLRLVRQGVEVTLRATSCQLDGRPQEVAPCEAIVRYLVNNDAHSLRLQRQEIIFANDLPESDAAIWKKALTLFFADNMRPLPKFHNTSFSQYLQVGYLNIDDGWLVVGAKRASESVAPTPVSLKGGSQ